MVCDDHPKRRRILNALAKQYPVGFRVDGEIRPEQGVGKSHHHRPLEEVLSAQDGMGGAQRLVLVADVPFGAQSLGDGHEFPLDFGTEVADDKADVVHPVVGRSDNVLDQPLDDGLARQGNERFGNGEGVGAKAASAARHGHNDVHAVRRFPCGQTRQRPVWTLATVRRFL